MPPDQLRIALHGRRMLAFDESDGFEEGFHRGIIIAISFATHRSFETTEEAQEQATNWLRTYNNDHPNMGISGITPAMKLQLTA